MTEQEHKIAPAGGLNPFQALTRLSHAITAIDYLLDQKPGSPRLPQLKRRIVYARNTLVVALQLWQGDVLERLAQSGGSFYVYCMIDAERLAFLRRMRPALEFTAEEIRSIDKDLGAFDHVIPLVEQAMEDVILYATENRHSLIMAKEALAPGAFPDVIEHKTLKLPAEEGIPASSNRGRGG